MEYKPFTHDQLAEFVNLNSKRLCLFAHYAINEFSSNSHEYVQELSKYFDQVIVLTNLNCKTMYDKVKFVTVENKFLDIGMWMRVLTNLDIIKYDTIALVNDSCILTRPLHFVFNTARSNCFSGVWGICDSYEIRHHIQSFFLVYEKKALHALADFVLKLANDMPRDDRANIIQKSEIGMSAFIQDRNISMDVIFKWENIIKFETKISKTEPFMGNPSYYFWDRMLQLGCPLLKKKRWTYQNEELFIKKQSLKKTILIYIVYHDNESGIKAHAYANILSETQPLIDIVPIRVSNMSPYFESQVFSQMDTSSHSNYDWVGVITHGYHTKLGPNPPNIQDEIAKAEQQNADVVSLFNLDFGKPRVKRDVSFIESIAMQHGPYLWMAIHHIFKIQGFKEEQVMNKDIKGFFSNWWLAKPNVMAKYVKFFNTCQKLVTTHPQISSYIQNDSFYLGYAHKQTIKPDRLMEIFGQEYYCLHPFLFERIPPIFVHVMGYKVYRGGVTFAWDLHD